MHSPCTVGGCYWGLHMEMDGIYMFSFGFRMLSVISSLAHSLFWLYQLWRSAFPFHCGGPLLLSSPLSFTPKSSHSICSLQSTPSLLSSSPAPTLGSAIPFMLPLTLKTVSHSLPRKCYLLPSDPFLSSALPLFFSTVIIHTLFTCNSLTWPTSKGCKVGLSGKL